jgi:hypothetical protein
LWHILALNVPTNTKIGTTIKTKVGMFLILGRFKDIQIGIEHFVGTSIEN